jgi:hypothetical protein
MFYLMSLEILIFLAIIGDVGYRSYVFLVQLTISKVVAEVVGEQSVMLLACMFRYVLLLFSE